MSDMLEVSNNLDIQQSPNGYFLLTPTLSKCSKEILLIQNDEVCAVYLFLEAMRAQDV